MKRLLITLSLVALMLAGCGGSADPTPAPPPAQAEPVEAATATPTPPAEPVEAEATATTAPTDTPTVTPTPSPAPTDTPEPTATPVASRCQPAAAGLLDSIAQGLTVDGGGDLRNGWTVRSADYEQAYFVAADITGPGMDSADTIGLWVTNDPEGLGAIFSVDAFANEFSDWADGGATGAAFSQSDDGAREALDCASQ